MFESRTQVKTQIMVGASTVNPDVQSGDIIPRDTAPCRVPGLLQLPVAGGAFGRATFEHLKVTGELHGY
jgi:hypothetical protein